MKKALYLFAALGLLSACTGGGAYSVPGGGGGGGGHPPPVNVVTIDVSLTQHGTTNTPYGTSTGFAPPVTMVSVGSMIQFKNSDGFSHTATTIQGASMFPAASPFSNGALTQSGSTLSSGFSSGTLQGGSNSQMLLVDKAGVYLYGCFFHYSSAGMRAAIVAT